MRLARWSCAVIGVALCTASGPRCAAAGPPKFDWGDVGASIRRLNAAKGPEARAIRRRVADGPAARAREKRAAILAGVPLTARELEAHQPAPDRNAVPDYRRLAAILRRAPLSDDASWLWEVLQARRELAPGEAARLRAALDARKDVFGLLHAATDKPGFAMVHVWTPEGMGQPMTLLATLREAAKLIRVNALLYAVEGRYQEAAVEQGRGLRLAAQVYQDPTLIGYLVAAAIHAIALAGMQDILLVAGPNADASAAVERETARWSPRESLVPALKGEPIYGLAYTRMLRGKGPQWLAGAADIPLRSRRAFTPAEKAWVMRALDAWDATLIHRARMLIAAADAPWPEMQAAFAKQASEAGAGQADPVAILLAPTTSLLPRLPEIAVRARARAAVTLAGAEILAERARTGSFPAEAPAKPAFLDPFSGKPLRLRREGDGFVVYSVGIDGRYDGGKPGQRAGGESVFRYPGGPVPSREEMEAEHRKELATPAPALPTPPGPPS